MFVLIQDEYVDDGEDSEETNTTDEEVDGEEESENVMMEDADSVEEKQVR